MAAGLSFELLACRLCFSTDGEIHFPARASNVFRGALGYVLPEEIFRPKSTRGPSGLADAPRPFVLQAKELDGLTVASSSFGCDLNLFDPRQEPEFKRAFERVAETGIGPTRTRLRLLEWTARPVEVRLNEAHPASRVRVHFETPVELKGWDGEGLPGFGVLLSRLRDRLSALRALYGAGALEMDFRAFGERAKRVVTAGGQLDIDGAERRSSRTGQTHPLGGMTGLVDYEGELGEFVPYLRAAAYTGVGRQTVWGHGRLGLEILGQ
jgi:hypothetical protein